MGKLNKVIRTDFKGSSLKSVFYFLNFEEQDDLRVYIRHVGL